MLLYLVKNLCPDLANVTGELSKANDRANPAAYKELLCVVKYVLDTEMLGLEIESLGNSNKPWEIVCFSNSNYAGHPASRQSISGFILYVLGIPAFSSSEAEYIALSEAVKEVMFVAQL